jgi:LytS/YehU family sensor histidine kinase
MTNKFPLDEIQPFWSTWWFFALIMFHMVVVLAVVFFIIIRNVRNTNMLRQELIRYRLLALGKQMNPHFIFNALNSIQHYILQNDKRQSNRYLIKFSNLMRIVLNNSQHQLIPIQDEISALELYLELEQLRLRGRFSYTISVDDKIDQITFKIPPMLIQPYVENAIWHGIMNKEDKQPGTVQVVVTLEGNIIYCRITDNGIGRKKALELRKTGTEMKASLGENITSTRLSMISQLTKKEMKVVYDDMEDENGSGTGTKVEIRFPILN